MSTISRTILAVLLYFTASRAVSPRVNNSYCDLQHCIYVSTEGSEDAVSDERCWTGRETMPCSSLALALAGAQNYLNSTAVILRDTGEYFYHVNNFTSSEILPLRNISKFTLLGVDDNVSVACGEDVGLAFYNSTQVRIEGIAFRGCRMVLPKHSNFSGSEENAVPPLPHCVNAGIQFTLCEDIDIVSVEVSGSRGCGMALLEAKGDINISKSRYICNANSVNNITTTVGMYVVQGNPSPTDKQTRAGKYTLKGCIFETLDDFSSTNSVNTQACSGLVMYFQNSSKENIVVFQSCTFKGNVAPNGAGMLVYFEDGSRDNSLTLSSTDFVSNLAHSHNIQEQVGFASTSGGIKIQFVSHGNNSVAIRGCVFHNNSANLGGGIAIRRETTATTRLCTNSEFLPDLVLVDGCEFTRNHAIHGAAIDVYGDPDPKPLQNQDCRANISVANCVFVNNGIPFGQLFSESFSIVNLHRITACFSGHSVFEGSEGTPLLVRDSVVTLAEGSAINFTGNVAHNGGAVRFADSGRIIVHSGAKLFFTDNTAFENGGAIYSDDYNEHATLFTEECFFQSYDPAIHPDDWNASFNFSGNTAGKLGNSIFLPSLIRCTWPAPMESVLNGVFCWNGWHYESSSCKEQVMTAPAFLENGTLNLIVFPGKLEQLNLNAYDELLHDVSAETVYAPSMIKSPLPVDIAGTHYISSGGITLFGTPNSSVDLSLETIGTKRSIQAEIRVTILPCPPAFKALKVGNDTFTCVCGGDFGGDLICNTEMFTAFANLGNCISFDKDMGQPIMARCPYYLDYAQQGFTVIPLSKDSETFNEDVCGIINRDHKLCSQCIENYGIAPLSYGFECVRCSGNVGGRWLAFILAKFAPITVFFLVIVGFNISVTSAPTNALIFFSQVVTVSRGVLILQAMFTLFIKDGDVGLSIILIPYSIWNLDFLRTVLPPFCVDHNLRALHILVLEYVAAFYPLVLVGVTYFSIQHGRNFKLLVWLWSPFQKCFSYVMKRGKIHISTSNSIIHAFAAFLLISYSKIIVVSLSLLTPSDVRYDSGRSATQVLWYDGSIDFLRGYHLFYAIPAILILVVFISVPPLLLLLYPFSFFQRFLHFTKLRSLTLNTFVEVFQGCYRDGTKGTADRRYFAGLYFVFRIVAFSLWATVINDTRALFLSLQFVFVVAALLCGILQPYKVDYYNKLDLVIFINLAMITAMLGYLYSNFIRTLEISTTGLVTAYILLLLPFLYVCGYVLYWIVRRKKSWSDRLDSLLEKLHIISIDAPRDTEADGEERETELAPYSLPDRVLNPSEYSDAAQDMYPSHGPHTPSGEVNQECAYVLLKDSK